MSQLNNPTKTRGIEKAWLRDINRRWRKYKKSVVGRLIAENKQAQIINRAPNPFVMDASQQRVYMTFVESQIYEILLGVTLGLDLNWQSQYQLQSYTTALERSRNALRLQGATLIPTSAESMASSTLTPF